MSMTHISNAERATCYLSVIILTSLRVTGCAARRPFEPLKPLGHPQKLAMNPNGDLRWTKEHKQRVRLTQACDYCVKRRRRCSGLPPCALCSEADVECTFSRQAKRRGPPKGFRAKQQSPRRGEAKVSNSCRDKGPVGLSPQNIAQESLKSRSSSTSTDASSGSGISSVTTGSGSAKSGHLRHTAFPPQGLNYVPPVRGASALDFQSAGTSDIGNTKCASEDLSLLPDRITQSRNRAALVSLPGPSEASFMTLAPQLPMSPSVVITSDRMLYGEQISDLDHNFLLLDASYTTGLTPTPLAHDLMVDTEDYFSGVSRSKSGSTSSESAGTETIEAMAETDFDRFRREMATNHPVVPHSGAAISEVHVGDHVSAAMFSGEDAELDGTQQLLVAQAGLPHIDYVSTTQAGFQFLAEDGTVTIVSPGTMLAALGAPDGSMQAYSEPDDYFGSKSIDFSLLSGYNSPLAAAGALFGDQLEIPSNPSLFADLPALPPLGVITHLVLAFPQYMDSLSTMFHRTFWESIHVKPQWLLVSMAALVAPLCEALGPNRFSVGANLLERARRMLLFVGSSGGIEGIAAMFFCVVATSTSWNKGSGAIMDSMVNLTVSTARQLRINIEPEEECDGALGNKGNLSRNENWIERETRRRVWWTIFMMDRIATLLSDRPPLITTDTPHPHLPIPEALWAAPPSDDGTYFAPLSANTPSLFLTLPDAVFRSQPEWNGWSEWAVVIMIHRALGEVVRWLHYVRDHHLDPYAAPAASEKLQVKLAREEAIRMFKEVLSFLDMVYSRLPTWFGLVESDPSAFLDPEAGKMDGLPMPRDKRTEAAHLLIYLHTTYALLFAPKVPDPELLGTNLWMQHQPILGIPCSATEPIRRIGSAGFPFAMEAPWLARGPDARLKPGDFCPSPSATCHFHTDVASRILQGLLGSGDEAVVRRMPPFVMWCSAQTFFYRFLLAHITYAKLVGVGEPHSIAMRRTIAETEKHMMLMNPMRKRWKAADASARHMRHMIRAAVSQGDVPKEEAIFSAVGVIHESYGKDKVDRVISYIDEVEGEVGES